MTCEKCNGLKVVTVRTLGEWVNNRLRRKRLTEAEYEYISRHEPRKLADVYTASVPCSCQVKK